MAVTNWCAHLVDVKEGSFLTVEFGNGEQL
jgi:hypothetical protein